MVLEPSGSREAKGAEMGDQGGNVRKLLPSLLDFNSKVADCRQGYGWSALASSGTPTPSQGVICTNVVEVDICGPDATGTIGNNIYGLAGLTSGQVQALVDLLSNHKQTMGSENLLGNQWILDTEASNHMTGKLETMENLYDIDVCPMRLPNGQETVLTKEGSVKLEGGLVLTNVLYVPKLSCNLISVSQLSDEQNRIVQFTNRMCVMQDLTLRMLIGAGKRRGVLYYYKGITNHEACKTECLNQVEFWH
ncbi:hypothetical protein L6164_013345 [Bauhinia variegata]|uniref:Uncharacterized protein n=1 Tax=Bauhinia variegata TaxID=167791 RepID=A0ACB9PE88_BAUVA|nr:hypothetical protein L6164_013345 [Bauhinia variegata]